ncbi:MAG TPA: hypothetical protein DD387_10895 [Lachnoclostridium sp.]|nr:hypothetical protein [Lachnoclostridium sp.]
MKKYRICLFLFLGVSVICILIAFFVRRSQEGAGLENRNETGIEQLETEETQETVVEDQMAANQERVQAHPVQEEYYLVAEDGMLLIFLKDQKTICLYTHMPLMDFPSKERTKLREGIWFSSMAEVFHYLESYTS